MKKKPIGVYTISNTISISVYEIDHTKDQVLASGNGEKPHWCPIVYGGKKDENDFGEFGFMFGEMFIAFSAVMKL